MKQYMLLWNYQDNGHTHYRFKTNGDNCKACTELDGKVFSIADAEVGVNLAPIHPNCDCTAEVLDENEAEIFTVKSKTEDDEKSSVLDYLQTSLNQVLLGNYADDTNALGTLGQIAIGLLGLDLPADIRDLVYDITNFKLTPQHALQTILDIAALLPVVGGVKYVDETGDLVKSAAKHGDEVTKTTVKTAGKLPWDSWQAYEKITQDGQTYAKIGNRLYTKHAVNRMQPSGNRFGPNIYQGLGGKDYGRSISPQFIEDVISSTKPIYQPETGNFVHTLGTVKVIVNSQGAVITVITYQ